MHFSPQGIKLHYSSTKFSQKVKQSTMK
uniref:Uncharacterized protein n=1 Tax=Arundo donax TaxID=35708 RepID=A0A0A8YJ66_ARUDO